MAAAGGGRGGRGGDDEGEYEETQTHDRFLPIANISRIMKKSLPEGAKIARDAKETVQESVSEFISFVTGEASDKCQQEKRKTINGDDILWALGTLGFENKIPTLQVYLRKYREVCSMEDETPQRKAVRAEKPERRKRDD